MLFLNKRDMNMTKNIPSFKNVADVVELTEEGFFIEPNKLMENNTTLLAILLNDTIGDKEFNDISKEQWDYLMRNTDLTQPIWGKYNYLFFVLYAEGTFELNEEYLEMAIKACNYTSWDTKHGNEFYDILRILRERPLPISAALIDYMINKIDLSLNLENNANCLTMMLRDFKLHNFLYSKLSPASWELMFNKCSLDAIAYVEEDQTWLDIPSLIARLTDEGWKAYLLDLYKVKKEELNKKVLVEEYKNLKDSVIGLEEVKSSFDQLIKLEDFNKERGIQSNYHNRMIYVGNHGTGKTLISDYTSKLFYALGLTTFNSKVIVFNDLFDRDIAHSDFQYYVGKTIYWKFDIRTSSDERAEVKIIEAIKSLGSSTLVILSVTPEELELFKSKYPKAYAMFTKTMVFNDYSDEQLIQMSEKFALNYKCELTEQVKAKLKEYFEKQRKNKLVPFSNAYVAKNVILKMIELHALKEDSPNGTIYFSEEDIPSEENNNGDKPLEDLIKEITDMVGLESVKETLVEYISLMRANKRRGTKITTNMHLVFTGNPGTGKTTIARLIGKIYRALGLLSSGHVVEVDRAGLVAGYIGQTALKTKEAINKAMGGVLFIDEAYTLGNDKNRNSDFGKESVEILMKMMEDYRKDFAVILAGYKKPMDEFMEINPGLKSRFPKEVLFEDYSIDELVFILKDLCDKEKMKYDQDFIEEAKKYLEKIKKEIDGIAKNIGFTKNEVSSNDKNNKFGNAREVRTLFEKVLEKQAVRIMKDESLDAWQLTKEDILAIKKTNKN